jgi:hypothetical protein
LLRCLIHCILAATDAAAAQMGACQLIAASPAARAWSCGTCSTLQLLLLLAHPLPLQAWAPLQPAASAASALCHPLAWLLLLLASRQMARQVLVALVLLQCRLASRA